MPVMNLPCEMTSADRLRVGEQLTSEIVASEQVEAAKKEALRGFKGTLKQHRKSIHDLNESLRTGKEAREVEIEERPDFEAGIVYIWRLDTNECCQQRAIDPDERQVKLGIDGPKLMDGGKVDATDEQCEATSPDEAEALRAERLAQERAERVSAAVTEARSSITVAPHPEGGFMAEVFYGDRSFGSESGDEETARRGVELQLTEFLEAEEDKAAQWADAVAASEAEQTRQAAEVAALAADQAADDKATKRRTLKVGAGDGLKSGGLKAPPKRKRVKVVDANDQPIEGADADETPTPGDDGPVSTGEPVDDGAGPDGLIF